MELPEKQGNQKTESEISIKICNASFGWKSNSKAILSNLNFEIKKGELFILIGPVGSGKSTFLLSLLHET